MTKTPWALLTEGSASLHNASESAGSLYSKRFNESWAGRRLGVGRAQPHYNYSCAALLSESGYSRMLYILLDS